MSHALYRTWRSKRFADLVGQPHIVQTLENALVSGRVAHAYLFNGPRGTGKTSTARILAKALCCQSEGNDRPCGACRACTAIDESRHLDVNEIDAASNNGVDDVRELRHQVQSLPTEGEVKIFIIDEVHMLSSSAFNALLKTLEEPPGHAYFMLATTEAHRIPATVISRCQRFDFRRITAAEIKSHLNVIAKKEGYNIEEPALSAISNSVQGCMRDAIGLLDQLVSFGHELVSQELVHSLIGLADAQTVNAFVEHLIAGDKQQGLMVLENVVQRGNNLSEFLKQLVTQLRWIYRTQLDPTGSTLVDVSSDQVKVIQGWAEKWSETKTLHTLSTFLDTLSSLGPSNQPMQQTQHPQIQVEIALVQAIDGPVVAPLLEKPVAQPETRTPIAQPETRPKSTTSTPRTSAAPARTSATPVRDNGKREPAVTGKADSVQQRPGMQVPKSETEQKLITQMRNRWKSENLSELALLQGSDRLRSALRHIQGLRVFDNTIYILFKSAQDCDLASRSGWFHDKMQDYVGFNARLVCQQGDDFMMQRPKSGWEPSTDAELNELCRFITQQLGAKPMSQHEVDNLLDRFKEIRVSE